MSISFPSTATFKIPANVNGGINTGIQLKAGQIFSVSASGSWCYYQPCVPGESEWGPDGSPSHDPYVLLPTEPVAELIGKISPDGSWFAVGSAHTITADTTGTLYLSMNDVGIFGSNQFVDNSGAVFAAVSFAPIAPSNTGSSSDQAGWTCQPTSGHPIELRYGEKTETVTDLRVTSPAGSLDFIRTYRQAKQSLYDQMGLGWTHNHNVSLSIPSSSTLLVQLPSGGEAHFIQNGTNHFDGLPGIGATVDLSGSQYIMTNMDKSTFVFQDINADGIYELISHTWPTALFAWTYTYTSGKLTQVDDGYGHQLYFSYISNPGQFNDGQLWRVGDQTSTGLSTATPAGRYVEFGYSPEANNGVILSSPRVLLTSVQDVRGNSWQYDYYGQHINENSPDQLNYLTALRSPLVDVTGDGLPDLSITRKKVSYTTSNGTVTALSEQIGLVGSSPIPLQQIDYVFQPNGQNLTTETVAGKTASHIFNNGVYGGLQDPAGNFNAQNINFQYRPTTQVDARGNQTQLQWSADGKYLNQVTDALGSQTAFAYNSGGATDGTLQFSLDSAGRKTLYTYGDTVNNPRVPTRVQVYAVDGKTVLYWQEFVYDTLGRTVAEKTFDPTSGGSVLVQETDRNYYTTGTGNGFLWQLIQRDLLNPANNVTTTYFYDTAGRVIHTNQSATFGNCTSSFTLYDAASSVLASVCQYDPGANADPTTLAGLLALYNPLTPEKNRITTYRYDVLGRRVSTTTDAAAAYSKTSLTVYDALDRVVRTITNYVPNRAVPDPYTHPRADWNHGVNQDQNLLSDTVYNERGLVRSQMDVLGTVTLFGYDDADRLVKTVSVASQPTYDNSYTTGDPSLGRYVPNAAPDQDLITTSVYDAVGNLVKSIDTLGVATFTIYDALNRPVKTVRSASTPSYPILNDPALLNYPFSLAADADLVEVTEYDALGRVRRSQDTLGNWTLYGYDSLDHQVKVVRYASQPSYNLTVDPALAHYLPADAPDVDIISTTAYDNQNRVMYTADVLGRKSWTGYDGLGRAVRSITNASGSATDGTAHDPRSATYSAVTASDQDLVALTTFDANGYVLWTQDPVGRRTWPVYDNIGRQIRTVSNPSGTATNNGVHDPRHPNYIVSPTSDTDVISKTVYDAQGRVSVTIDPLGHETHYFYDALGRRLQTISNFVLGTSSANRPDQDLTSTTVYDLAGRVVSTIDVRGTRTTFTYDRAGRRLTTTQAAGTSLATTSYTCYDKGGRVLRVISNWSNDPGLPSPDAQDTKGRWLFNPKLHGNNNDTNLITTFTLNRLGRQVALTDVLGNVMRSVYYRDSQLESMTDVLGVVTKYRYDNARRRTLAVTSYNAGSFTDPATWTWSTTNNRWQDAKGNAITFGPNNDQNIIVQTTFDKAGRMLALRDPRGNRTTYTYDLLNRRTSLTDPLAHVWTTQYVNNNDLLQTTLVDPLGHATIQTADRLGRLAKVQYASSDTPDVFLAYDKGGNRLSMSEQVSGATVRTTTYQYDLARRLRQVNVDTNGDGVVDQTLSYSYDAGGLRTRFTLPGNLNMLYQYDAKGRLTTLTDWSSQQTAYTYDQGNRLASVNRSNGLLSQYQYDPAGRLTSLNHTSGTRTLGRFAYTVDARGNRTQAVETVARYTAGTTLSYNDAAITYSGNWTDAAPFKQSLDFTGSLKIPFANDKVTVTMGVGPDHSLYDVYIDGDLWSTLDGYASIVGTTSFTIPLSGFGTHLLEIRNRPDHNGLSTGFKIRFQSLQLQGQAYDYQTVRYTYDALARLLTADTYAGLNWGGTAQRHDGYTFDVAGNRTQQVVTVGTTTTTNYTYDAANRLTSGGASYDAAGRMTSDGVNSYTWDRANRLLSMGTATYAYNGLGQRVQQTVTGIVSQYVLDTQPGLEKVVQSVTGGNTTNYIHSLTGVHQQQNPGGAWNWMVQDGLGSVREVIDATATPLESLRYSPYGEVYATSGSSLSIFGFTGEPTDANGLVNLRARYYNPSLGQFFSLDPLETPNRYQYVGGNVVNWVDPSGMMFDIPRNNCSSDALAPGCSKHCEGTGIFFGACMTLCNTQAQILHEIPRIIDGYLEGDTGPTITIATTTHNNVGHVGPFDFYGHEVAYDFVTFQKMLFGNQIVANSAVAALAINSSVYAGAIFGFTPSGASPENFEHFGGQYGGTFNFVSGGAGLGIKIPIFPGASATVGITGFASPDYSIVGVEAYFSLAVVSAGGVSAGPFSFDAGWGKTITTPWYSTGKSYLKDCQVDIDDLATDIYNGTDGIAGLYDAVVSWRKYAVQAALWAGLAYNLNHQPCYGDMG